ncbi:MAG: RluA family pseudouridine synthase [Candidatus Omnitrophica bacterium]|nr:RluA family pseudouridine synthase [Candidatus Omnitrophota bacterium]
MEEMTFVVEDTNSGGRLDVCVAERLGRDYSRTYVKNLINAGSLLVNGRVEKPNYKVRTGDQIKVSIEPAGPVQAEPENIPLDIVHEDEHLAIVNKRAGMVVHPGAGNRSGTLVNAMLGHCSRLPDNGDPVRPGIVHRLDKGTSGIMIVAKTDRAMRSLSRQFRERTVEKVYAALVRGRVELDNGVIAEPVGRHISDRKRMMVDHTSGRNARTVYHVVRRYEGFTFIRLDLHTGRTHQIRVHMKHLGYPVLGDRVYGGDRSMDRQALHAESITFDHPGTRERVEFSAPLPRDMAELIKKGAL